MRVIPGTLMIDIQTFKRFFGHNLLRRREVPRVIFYPSQNFKGGEIRGNVFKILRVIRGY
jgi:hypothetical protein